jgi:hypothetical protein
VWISWQKLLVLRLDLREEQLLLVSCIVRYLEQQLTNYAGQAFGGPKITKDGVSVAKAITLKDPVENLGAR